MPVYKNPSTIMKVKVQINAFILQIEELDNCDVLKVMDKRLVVQQIGTVSVSNQNWRGISYKPATNMLVGKSPTEVLLGSI